MNINDIIQITNQLNWLEIVGAVSGLLAALIVIFELIPGDQPEKALRVVVNLLAKFSRK
jgi:hypothetical protein